MINAERKEKKQWQNLIRRSCIHCGSPLSKRKDHVMIYECPNGDFIITERKLFEILMDETHILRRYLTLEEREKLNGVIDNITQ